MVSQKQSTEAEQLHSPYQNRTKTSIKHVFKCLSALMLPLIFGVFTVVITIYQQKVAREQRLEDMQLARQHWLDDKNESRIQREQEWNISQSAQAAQSKALIDQYRDGVLVDYIKEIGDLMKENNGSLTPDSFIHTLARVKTLNVLRQLDGSRQIHVIRFLYEAKQLTNTNESIALDISTAELAHIDFRRFTPSKKMEKISLAGV